MCEEGQNRGWSREGWREEQRKREGRRRKTKAEEKDKNVFEHVYSMVNRLIIIYVGISHVREWKHFLYRIKVAFVLFLVSVKVKFL